jgi:phage anti-repressor protein
MELIKVSQNAEGQSVVSARDLYAFLEVNEQFTDWANRMLGYGFEENQDYVRVFQENLKNLKGGRPSIDYALTLDCAREISMLQRNDKGKQARQYFLDCEKKLKAIQQNLVTEDRLNRVLTIIEGNFTKVGEYMGEMEERLQALEANHQENTGKIDDTEKRVDKIEEHLDFKSIACVYVMFCPHRKLYKFGSSHDAKGRRKQFSVVYANLEIMYEIPTISRDEAYTLENALKKRFKKKHAEGEWYALDAHDLEYLYEQQQNNRKHLANVA